MFAAQKWTACFGFLASFFRQNSVFWVSIMRSVSNSSNNYRGPQISSRGPPTPPHPVFYATDWQRMNIQDYWSLAERCIQLPNINGAMYNTYLYKTYKFLGPRSGAVEVLLSSGMWRHSDWRPGRHAVLHFPDTLSGRPVAVTLAWNDGR